MGANDMINVVLEDDAAVVSGGGAFAPIGVSLEGDACSVYITTPNGKPIATLKVINKETGEEIPVNVSSCTEGIVCNQGITVEQHLKNLYEHSNNDDVHLTGIEKGNLETKQDAQAKADKAKSEAITAASLLVDGAKVEAAADATQKANAARDAAYKNASALMEAHSNNQSNPHNVTAAQVGLDKVPNKSTNDLVPTYTAASTLEPLSSGERLAVAFGKVAKAVVDLIAHIGNKNNPHAVTAAQAGAVPKTGGTMTGSLTMDGGHIILKEGVNYGDELPEPGIPGRIFFKKVSS